MSYYIIRNDYRIVIQITIVKLFYEWRVVYLMNDNSSKRKSVSVNKKYKRLSNDYNNKSAKYSASLSRTMTFLMPSFISVVLAATVFAVSNDNKDVLAQPDTNNTVSKSSSESVPLVNASNKALSNNIKSNLNSSSSNYEKTFMSTDKSYDYRSASETELDDEDVVIASGLYINDEFIGATESQAELDFLLNGMLNKKVANDQDSVCYFAENVECIKGAYPSSSVMSYNDIKNAVNSNKVENVVYTVNEGDTIETIAASTNSTIDEICETNQISAENEVSQGDVLSVPQSKPYLSFCVEKNIEYEKEITYNTITINDENHYKGYSNVVTQGVNGIMQCVDNVKYENGVEVSRTPMFEEVKVPAVDMVIEIGTKELISNSSIDNTAKEEVEGDGVATSEFIWPVTFTHNVTSPYGERWGTFHNGIDIAGSVSYGQDILASDGGVVTRAGDLNDGYGNYVIIDHGNGYKTLYAHASALYVQVGQRVSKGQKIAEIGSTGYSTGPHLHFEILYNNKNIDPLKFVS